MPHFLIHSCANGHFGCHHIMDALEQSSNDHRVQMSLSDDGFISFGSGRVARLCLTYSYNFFKVYFIFNHVSLCEHVHKSATVWEGQRRWSDSLELEFPHVCSKLSSGPLQEPQCMVLTVNRLHTIFCDVFNTTALVSLLTSSVSCLHLFFIFLHDSESLCRLSCSWLS